MCALCTDHEKTGTLKLAANRWPLGTKQLQIQIFLIAVRIFPCSKEAFWGVYAHDHSRIQLKKESVLSPRYTCCIGCFVLRWECHWQPHPFLFAVAVHVAAVVLNDILNDRWKNLYIRTDKGREEVKTGSKRIAEVVFTQITLHRKMWGKSVCFM